MAAALGRVDAAAALLAFNASGATGRPRVATRVRSLPAAEAQGWEALLRPAPPPPLRCARARCERWAVFTTIFPPSEAVRRASWMAGWCVVAVADLRGPATWDDALARGELRANSTVYLTVPMQRAMARDSPLVDALPWNHFARKNIGYLYAIRCGARLVLDIDDDNELSASAEEDAAAGLIAGGARHHRGELHVAGLHELPLRLASDVSAWGGTALTVNPYPLMGASNPLAWPRGLPLSDVRDALATPPPQRAAAPSSVGVLQLLADHDPDVDALYRLTAPPQHLHFHFAPAAPPLGVPAGRFAPYNAQATVHSYRALWALLLPMSVPGRVSDIWRGYAAQRLLWDVGLHLAFAPPRVTQRRNAHNLAADVQAEAALYLETESLLRFLHGWRCSAHCRRPLRPPPPPAAACPRLPFCMLELWGALYEHGFVKLADVRLLRLWVGELLGAGYVFPPYLEPLHARTAVCMTGFPRSFFSRFPEQVEHTPSPSNERGLPKRWWEEVAWAGAADPRFPHEMVLATSLRNHLLRPLSAYGGYDLFIIEPGLTHDARYEQLLRTDTLNALGVADGYFLQQAGPEQPLHYDNSSKRWRLYISESSVQSLLWQLKHLDMCHDLVAAHAEQHGLEYKYAIKVRPDVAYTKPVPPLHLLDLHPHPEEPARERSRHARSTIFVPAGIHNSKPRDHFAVGPYDAMRHYLQRYRAINTWAPLDIKRWTAEDFMSRYVSTAFNMRVSRELHVFGVRATNCKRQCERNGAASLFTRPSALDRREV